MQKKLTSVEPTIGVPWTVLLEDSKKSISLALRNINSLILYRLDNLNPYKIFVAPNP